MQANAELEPSSSSHILEFPRSHSQRYEEIIANGLSQNPRKSLQEAIQLIDEGYSHANALVGWIYEIGGTGLPSDFEKAAFYYKRAAVEVGSEVAWWGMARMNFFGRGIPQNYEEAFRCYSVMAESGSNPMAWLMLGWMYLDGKGVEQNLVRAREYLNKAAVADYVFAYKFLGDLEERLGRRWRAIGYFAKLLWKNFVIPDRDPRSKLG